MISNITDSLSNDIARVVDYAVDIGVSPKDFVQCVRECWRNRLQDKLSFEDAAFVKMLKDN